MWGWMILLTIQHMQRWLISQYSYKNFLLSWGLGGLIWTRRETTGEWSSLCSYDTNPSERFFSIFLERYVKRFVRNIQPVYYMKNSMPIYPERCAILVTSVMLWELTPFKKTDNVYYIYTAHSNTTWYEEWLQFCFCKFLTVCIHACKYYWQHLQRHELMLLHSGAGYYVH